MSIKKEIRSGIFYTFIFKYASYAFQLLTSAVLARLLTPPPNGELTVNDRLIDQETFQPHRRRHRPALGKARAAQRRPFRSSGRSALRASDPRNNGT